MMLVKFICNVWKDEIVPALSELHGTRWPGFDSEEMVNARVRTDSSSGSDRHPVWTNLQ